MGKVIGLDVGSRSLGIAMSDGLKMMAHSKENYRFEEKDFETATDHLLNNYVDNTIETIVVGLPKRLNNEASQTTEMVLDFIELLKSKTEIKIVTWDERLTTKIAIRSIVSSNIQKTKRKGSKDKVAASIILQDYLDSIN